MMHEMLERLAPYGGEGALALLFLLSVFSLGIISERLWYFHRTFPRVDQFVRNLAVHLHAGESTKALSSTRGSSHCVSFIAMAGLMQVHHGAAAAQTAVEIARARERVRLEYKLSLLKAIAHSSLLIGLTGTLFDLLAPSAPGLLASMTSDTVGQDLLHLASLTLAPAVAGLLVAIPSRFASFAFNEQTQRLLLDCDLVARLVTSHASLESEGRSKSQQSLTEAA